MSVFRALTTVLFLTCRQAAGLLSHHLDRRLPAHERAALALHLVTCRSCRRYRGQLATLRRALALIASVPAYPSTARLSPPATARIRAALERGGGRP